MSFARRLAAEGLGTALLLACVVGSGCHVGDAVAEIEEHPLLVRREDAIREACRVQRRPEAVARPREVVPHGGRVQPRVDAAEEDREPGRDDVGHQAPGGTRDLGARWAMVRGRGVASACPLRRPGQGLAAHFVPHRFRASMAARSSPQGGVRDRRPTLRASRIEPRAQSVVTDAPIATPGQNSPPADAGRTDVGDHDGRRVPWHTGDRPPTTCPAGSPRDPGRCASLPRRFQAASLSRPSCSRCLRSPAAMSRAPRIRARAPRRRARAPRHRAPDRRRRSPRVSS